MLKGKPEEKADRGKLSDHSMVKGRRLVSNRCDPHLFVFSFLSGRRRQNGHRQRNVKQMIFLGRFLPLCASLLILALSGCGGSSGNETGLKVGNVAPFFAPPSVDSATIRLADYEKYSKPAGLSVLAVNFGEPAGQEKTVSFFKQFNLTFPAVLDDGQRVSQDTYGVFGLPTT